MSERAVPPEHDPHFEEALVAVAQNARVIAEHYHAFVEPGHQLELPVYQLDDRDDYYEPVEHERLFMTREIDLSDGQNGQADNYHIWTINQRHNTVPADINIRVPLDGSLPSAEINKGTIHTLDNALHDLIKATGI